jgi:hypothetical protein
MASAENTGRGLRLFCILLVILLWPPLFVMVVHPRIAPLLQDPVPISDAELQLLFNARRYEIHVPEERDGWFLEFETIVDGKSNFTGGPSTIGGSDVVLLFRQSKVHDKIEYCLYADTQVTRGTFDDPLKEAAVAMPRPEGRIESGDWLMLGGRKSVQIGTSGTSGNQADFELRIMLRPPDADQSKE